MKYIGLKNKQEKTIIYVNGFLFTLQDGQWLCENAKYELAKYGEIIYGLVLESKNIEFVSLSEYLELYPNPKG